MWHRNWNTMLRSLPLMASLIMLAACTGQPDETIDATDTSFADNFIPVVSATGEVVPAQWATISSPASGLVSELLVAKSDWVESGQVLAHVGNEQALQAAIAAASLELVAAQQALDDIYAQAGMRAAQAKLELANARDALREAERKWQFKQEGQRGSSTTVRAAEAELALAKEAMDDAERDANKFSSGDPEHAQDYKNFAAAVQRYRSALASVNWYKGHPTEIQQEVLDGEVAAAQARLEAAQIEWEKWKDDPAEDEVALAEARLTNAEAQLLVAEAALAEMEIRAPFDGTVSDLYVRQSEWVTTGSRVLLLADLDNLEVETTDLNELDVARIAVGNASTVTFDSLPEMVVAGTVVSIAPKADEGTGVNYTAVIELSEIPDKLRWAMTAFVDVEVPE